ncbi:hypothetical protein HOK51_09645 [Candidatus Woesearchaeota archaeon]|jgi:hypothetical protein|nr:hypothetical protein [Candidatus Woesearchaeota archaeon]MBT6520086.1 hypothetical protein [Candidatus Woesearchaeota archaeon]MBT7366691.1 hypothetical protein [Candidatus Woesearchaeota archaeon]
MGELDTVKHCLDELNELKKDQTNEFWRFTRSKDRVTGEMQNKRIKEKFEKRWNKLIIAMKNLNMTLQSLDHNAIELYNGLAGWFDEKLE